MTKNGNHYAENKRPSCLLFVILVVAFFCQSNANANDRIAHGLVDKKRDNLLQEQTSYGWKGGWVFAKQRPARIVDLELDTPQENNSDTPEHAAFIQGTRTRNNPLRRQLGDTYQEQEVFIKFRFRYDPDKKGTDNSEFFICWLDRYEGTDQAVHASHVPNIGVHVAPTGPHKGKVVFMARIGSNKTAWSAKELKRGHEYVIVGRLSKPEDSLRAGYTRLDLWVDPQTHELDQPIATAHNPQSINGIKWVGFGTGNKTEADDQIYVSDLVLSRSWNDVLAISSNEFMEAHRRHDLVWDKPVSFKNEIYPILAEHCFDCHSDVNPDSGFRLDVFEELRGYSTGEEMVVPGKSHQSRLIEVLVSRNNEIRMPPEETAEPLDKELVAKLKAWIDQGAEWDHQLLPTPKVESSHWAFQKIVKPEVPQLTTSIPIRTPVDAFIQKIKQEHNLQPVPEADRRTLIRRLYLDLLGLLPTPIEVNEFVNNPDPKAYENLVEKLLASPHYGEHWARYWLDLTRWAESHGYQHDIPRPYAWRYRDYVIASFNKDKPYNRFLKEQLAGDELSPYSDENLIATGFLASARISGNQMDKQMQRNDVLIDIVNVTGSAIFGLTLECAQCHNHKFDPISQRDYYRLQGYFVNGQAGNLSLQSDIHPNPTDLKTWLPKGTYDFYQREAQKLIKQKKFQHTTIPHTWGYYSPLTGSNKITRLPVVNRDPIPYAPQELRETKPKMLLRGDVHKPGPEVGKGWPEVLGTRPPPSSNNNSRTELANWLSDRNNPLVSRVWVNRLWQYHFGRGLVSTPSDFGVLTAEPVQRELLDWLSVELMENGWSTKQIHRKIVLSTTFRQARSFNEQNHQIDPDNLHLWHWPRRRLTAEAIRDSVLCATQELKRELGGQSVPKDREEQNLRRTIYLFQRRSELPDFMSMFDAPDNIASCSRRQVSTVALQPLFMLNSDFMMNRAKVLAQSISDKATENRQQQINMAFSQVLGRTPSEREMEHSRTLISAGQPSENQAASLSILCHALLNLNEFIYIP